MAIISYMTGLIYCLILFALSSILFGGPTGYTCTLLLRLVLLGVFSPLTLFTGVAVVRRGVRSLQKSGTCITLCPATLFCLSYWNCMYILIYGHSEFALFALISGSQLLCVYAIIDPSTHLGILASNSPSARTTEFKRQ